MTTKRTTKGAKKAGKASKKASKGAKKAAKKGARAAATTDELSVRLAPQGPTAEAFASLANELLQHASLRELLNKTRSRVLTVEPIEPELEVKPARPPVASDRFRATIYDYTNDRALIVEGSLGNRRQLTVTETNQQPVPTEEEFEEAVRHLTSEAAGLGAALREKSVQPYRPMPPVLGEQQPDGRIERTVAVGLRPTRQGAPHEIVGVNLGRKSVVRFENRAPANAQAHNPICGQPDANQSTVNKGTPGQAWVTISQGGTTLWRFLVVRPAASSGTNGSGVELRFVDYRGKRVLYRAHVPILNVKYKGDACGPYRDWQWQEGKLQATGADVAPGFRLCPSPATTILDTGSDVGNFLGVAIYVQGKEVVLVSEMEAGWYRYVSQWRFHVNGTLRPRFGFSAVQSSCVCNVHYHHVYWRLDFDIRTAGNNIVREFNNPCLPGFCPSNWHTKSYEIMRPRDPARNRKWRVQNAGSGEAYDIIPGPGDNVASAMPDWPYGRGDLWFLRYRSTEIDDGSVAIGPPYEAGLNNWVNGESIKNQDVVVWYGAHFTHDLASEPPGTFGEIVGPDLVPVNW